MGMGWMMAMIMHSAALPAVIAGCVVCMTGSTSVSARPDCVQPLLPAWVSAAAGAGFNSAYGRGEHHLCQVMGAVAVTS